MPATPFNIAIVAQRGRLTYEAVLFAASLRHFDPGFAGRLIILEPQPGERWPQDPRIANPDARDLLTGRLGADIIPFETPHFGDSYPYGNKIEGLLALPEGQPFLFFDSDTLITGPLSDLALDFDTPSASEKVTGTWPDPQLYDAGYDAIWRSLYDRFGLDFETSLDPDYPPEFWRHYLYFNAGWFYHKCPHAFGQRFLDYATAIRDAPGDALAAQSLDPWLDQVALPLVIHSFGGGRGRIPAGTLDGTHSCHYRNMPLLFAREPDRVIDALREFAAPNWLKKVLKQYEPFKRFIYQNKGDKVRGMFDQQNLPRRERAIRNKIKSEGLWMR